MTSKRNKPEVFRVSFGPPEQGRFEQWEKLTVTVCPAWVMRRQIEDYNKQDQGKRTWKAEPVARDDFDYPHYMT